MFGWSCGLWQVPEQDYPPEMQNAWSQAAYPLANDVHGSSVARALPTCRLPISSLEGLMAVRASERAGK